MTPSNFEISYFRKRDQINAAFDDAYPKMHIREEIMHVVNATALCEDPEVIAGIDPAHLAALPSKSEAKAMLNLALKLEVSRKVGLAQTDGIKAQFDAGILTEAEALAAINAITL